MKKATKKKAPAKSGKVKKIPVKRTLDETITLLDETFTQVVQDVTKFTEQDNRAASTRARKGLQEIKKLAQEARIKIVEMREK